ncbi:cell division protein FtsQ/DivIB [Lacrimispora algidixylanolytica]|uniref:Cell division protein FtsQ n=1 Tax=Lacrimispora algidixylanolytica TaxID=94868 RepID=A0A419T256_9FIRM|nr:cell division protein FtsQ [Lacrimispora algidixylanolytica]RKD31508.1 cell division protein FtsQ [Lacrimispora algidixylanolytica]
MRYLKSSKGKIKIAIATAVLLLVAVVFLSLQIKEIKVTGNKKYTQEQIVNLLFKGSWDRNAIFCIYKDRFQKHEQIPFVEDYKIVFLSPVKVEVIVYEKTVVGFVSYMGSYMYFDKDGIIVESSSAELTGVPRIVGLQYGHIALHQPLPVENGRIFSEILTLTQLLSTHDISVDQIQYDSKGDASLTMEDIKVFLGSNNQMNGKISELKDQLPVLEGLKGTLYLDTYDEAETVTSYRFVKNN